MRYSISLSYDGSSFCGWQVQPNATTVQECLEKALSTLLKRGISVVGAGRTDTKVNAIGYVAHFDCEDAIDTAKLGYKLNAILPKSIVVHSVRPVPDDFHARFGATRREYTYFLHRIKDPFVEAYSYYWPYGLDVEAMNEAAKTLIGRHDFSCFEKLGSDNKSSVCTVYEAWWACYQPAHAALMGFSGPATQPLAVPVGADVTAGCRTGIPESSSGGAGAASGACSALANGSSADVTAGCRTGILESSSGGAGTASGDVRVCGEALQQGCGHQTDHAPGGAYLYFRISADRFLRNMVRAVVGTLLDVGRGRRTAAEFAALVLEAPAMAAAAVLVPAGEAQNSPTPADGPAGVARQSGGEASADAERIAAQSAGYQTSASDGMAAERAEHGTLAPTEATVQESALCHGASPEGMAAERAEQKYIAAAKVTARASCLRSRAGESVPGHALFLSKVEYQPAD